MRLKLVFAHDHRFKERNDCFYSNGSFPASIWKRYLEICDELVVVGRYDGLVTADDNGLISSSTSGVSFKFLPDLSNFRSLIFGNRAANEICTRIVADSDAVIARLPSRVGSLFVREAIRQQKPYALEVVGDPKEAFKSHGSLSGRLYARLAALELKKIVKNSLFTIYVTESYLQNLYPTASGVSEFCSNVQILPVDRRVLSNRLDRIERNSSNTVFGLIANFSASYKGIDVAIKSIAQVQDSFHSWELQIVGRGDPSYYMAVAASLGVSDKVKFVGSLPSGDSVFEWLDQVDVYLQPSLTEGLPRALVEAMSRGCPAIASNVGGIPELLSSAEMSPPGDYVDLADKILAIAKKQDVLRQLAIKNFNKAKVYYSDLLEDRRSRFWHSFRKHVCETGSFK